VKITSERVRKMTAALAEGNSMAIDVVVPLMRHTFAKEYGWSYSETNALTLREANQAMTLIGEDVSKRPST
jgi:hypothetical protein